MQYIISLLGTLIGFRILRKNKSFKKKIEKILKGFEHKNSSTTPLRNFEWVHHVSSLLMISSILLVLFIPQLIYPGLQSIFSPDGGYTFPVNGQYLFMFPLIILIPLTVNLLAKLLFQLIPPVRHYLATYYIYELLWISGKAKKLPNRKGRFPYFKTLANKYDVEKISRFSLQRALFTWIGWGVISGLIALIAINSYVHVTDASIQVNKLSQLSRTSYTWDDVEKITIEVETTNDDRIEPNFIFLFENGESVDIWDLTTSEKEDLLEIIAIAEQEGVFIVRSSYIPNLDKLQPRYQEAIREVIHNSGK